MCRVRRACLRSRETDAKVTRTNPQTVARLSTFKGPLYSDTNRRITTNGKNFQTAYWSHSWHQDLPPADKILFLACLASETILQFLPIV